MITFLSIALVALEIVSICLALVAGYGLGYKASLQVESVEEDILPDLITVVAKLGKEKAGEGESEENPDQVDVEENENKEE